MLDARAALCTQGYSGEGVFGADIPNLENLFVWKERPSSSLTKTLKPRRRLVSRLFPFLSSSSLPFPPLLFPLLSSSFLPFSFLPSPSLSSPFPSFPLLSFPPPHTFIFTFTFTFTFPTSPSQPSTQPITRQNPNPPTLSFLPYPTYPTLQYTPPPLPHPFKVRTPYHNTPLSPSLPSPTYLHLHLHLPLPLHLLYLLYLPNQSIQPITRKNHQATHPQPSTLPCPTLRFTHPTLQPHPYLLHLIIQYSPLAFYVAAQKEFIK